MLSEIVSVVRNYNIKIYGLRNFFLHIIHKYTINTSRF